MQDADKPVFVYTTWPTLDAATAAGRDLVESAVAACVNVWPGMTAVYRWEGRVESAAEVVMIVKTTAAAVPEVERRIRALHPATTPAIAVLAVTGGGADFLDWIAANVSA